MYFQYIVDVQVKPIENLTYMETVSGKPVCLCVCVCAVGPRSAHGGGGGSIPLPAPVAYQPCDSTLALGSEAAFMRCSL